MANYAFIDASGNSRKIQDSQVTYRGAWSSSGSYAPYDVVSGTLPRTANYVALGSNYNQPLPVTGNGTWSLMVELG